MKNRDRENLQRIVGKKIVDIGYGKCKDYAHYVLVLEDGSHLSIHYKRAYGSIAVKPK